MKVLVTGINKILGYHLACHLLEEGHEVRALLNAEAKLDFIENLGVEIITGNIIEPESVNAALKDVEAVFHCENFVQFFPPGGQIAWSINLEGTRNILIGMARAGVEKLIYVNSASSFGFGTEEEPANEESYYNCDIFNSPCLDSMVRAQELVKRYNETGRIQAVILNPTIPMGTHDYWGSPGVSLIEFVQNNRGWYGSGGLNIAGAKQSAEAVLTALRDGKPGRSYIIGGHNISHFELIRKISIHLGIPHPTLLANESKFMALGRVGSLYWKVTGKSPAITMETARMASSTFYYNSDRAIEELGLKVPPVDSILEEACQWYRHNLRRSYRLPVE